MVDYLLRHVTVIVMQEMYIYKSNTPPFPC